MTRHIRSTSMLSCNTVTPSMSSSLLLASLSHLMPCFMASVLKVRPLCSSSHSLLISLFSVLLHIVPKLEAASRKRRASRHSALRDCFRVFFLEHLALRFMYCSEVFCCVVGQRFGQVVMVISY